MTRNNSTLLSVHTHDSPSHCFVVFAFLQDSDLPAFGLVCAWQRLTACICGCMRTRLFWNTVAVFKDFFLNWKLQKMLKKVPMYVWTRPDSLFVLVIVSFSEEWSSPQQMCVDMVLQHGTEGKSQVVPPAVKGEDAAAQSPASKCA